MPTSPFPAPTPPALVGGQKYCPTCFGFRFVTVGGNKHQCPTCKGAGKRGAAASGSATATVFTSMPNPVNEGAVVHLTGTGLSVAAVGATPTTLWGPLLFAVVGTRIGDTDVTVTVPTHTQAGVAQDAPCDVFIETVNGAMLPCGNQTAIAAAGGLEVIATAVGAAPGGPNVFAAGGAGSITGTGFITFGGGVASVDIGGEACGVGAVADTSIGIFANVTPIGPSLLTVHFTNGDTATFPGVSIV